MGEANVADSAGRLSVDLRGTVSVVIGATAGIGSAIAVGLARSGASVVVAGRDKGRLAETRDLIAATGWQAHAERVDITVPESVAELAETIAGRYGTPRVLVNSAGVMVTKSAFDLTADDWDLIHDTPLRGPFLSCQAFGRQMAEAGYGKIVNLSSTWAFTVGDGRSSYSAAKAGLSHLTTALACEWATHGVRVNAIAPTATRTPAADRRIASDPEREAWVLSRIPMRRLATPDDIVGAALFLASSASDFITGETILVDGGWRAYK
jgi:NAD(P)-dependent dehydrogenase (short-subunit alcohol dehydrogenase family)